MSKLPLSKNIVPLLLLTFLVGGCGYYNPNILPDNAEGPPINLYVPIWSNPTNELGLESDIHNAISDWLLQSKRIVLKPGADQADYILSGRIVSVSYPGLSYDATDQAKALKAVLRTSYTIKEKTTGRVLWQTNNLTLEQTYTLGSSNAQTDKNKKDALRILADDVGEQIYIRAFRTLSKRQRRGGK